MNVAALLQETPSEDVAARRARSGSTAGGTNPGPPPGSAPPSSQMASADRERDRERERERDAWGRGRPPPPPGSAGLRSLVHSPVDTRSNPPDGYRSGAPLHIQSPPPSAMHHRNQPPLSPALSIKDSKNTSPSSSRASGYAGPHGHPHSSHPSPAMASLRPNAALASGSSANSVHNGSTSVNSGMGGGGEPRPASATGWPGPGYGGVERERRGSASAGIGGLLRSGQPHSQHSSHSASPVYEKEYQLPHQQQPGSRRKTVSSGGVALGGGQAANSSMPPPSQLVGPGTGTPPDDLPPLSHKSSSMAPPMSHSGALPSSMHGPPSAPTHQHTMSSSSFMERERDILLNREPRDHPMDHLRPSSTSGPAPPTSNPSGTPRQYHPSHGLPPSAPSVPRGGPPTSYSQPGSGRVTPLNDLERDRERERMYNREREHQHQRERALSSASASGAVGPSPMTSPRGVPYGPPPPPGHHSSQSLPPNSGQAGSPPGSSRSGGPGQSPHIHPASGASHAPPANPYAAASGGFGHAPYGSGPPPSSSGGGHGPPLPPTPSSAGPSTQSQLPSVGPPPPSSAKEREREFDMRDRERGKMAVERDRDFRDRDYQRERERERELRDREMSRDREMRERDMRDRELRDRELRERELRDREIRERDRERERDAVMREARPDPREMRDSRDVAGGSGGGRPDTREFRDARGEPRDVRADPRDLRTDPRADPYRERERDFRADTRDRERRDTRDRDWEMWDRKERERLDKLQWERDQQDREKEKERRDREQREHREQVDRQRELQEREAQEREKEQMMILREKVREKEMRDRERLLREREHQQLRERDGEARDGYTIIIGPGVPPSAPAAMRGEQQRAPAQGPPAGPSSITPGPHPPQSHHQGRFNTAFISNFAGPTERSSRNNSRVGSPNPVTLGSQMSTINMNVGSMPTIGPGVPGPANNSGGGMHVIPGGMLGGGLPSQGEPKGRGAASITSDRRDRDVRDLADSKDGIRDRERERERDHKKAMPMPQSSSSRVPGPSPKDQLPQAAIREGREKERERERERELYAAAIAGGSSTGPSGPSGRRHEGEHHVMGHSRHPSQAQQQQQQNMRERERDRERERERETRRHQSGPYPHQYDDIPGPRDRERERERDHGITIINPGQITPQSRDVDVEMGYGYPPPPHHTMGPPPPPGWHDVPGGPTPMEMGYHPGPPASHHPMHHHPPPQSQPYANYHPPPPGPYSAGGPPPPGYGQPPPPGYGHPHSQQQQYAYDDRGMPAPVDVNGVHHGSNGVVIVGGGNGAMHPGHSMPPAPPPHQQHPHHPPQHMYSVPPGYMSMQSGHHGLAVHGTDGAALGPGLTLPPSTLALTAASPLESLEDQPEDLKAAQESALLRLEEEREHERKPEVKAKTTVTLGTFVYPNLPFPYNFDLGGGIVTGKQVIVQEEPDKEPLSKEVQERNVVAKADGAEEGEIAEPADKGKAASSAVKDEPAAKPTKTSVVDPPAARTPTTDSYSAREADLDGATKVDDVEVDVETRVTIVVPHGHLPDEKPTRPRIWGGGVPPVSPFASNPKSGPSQSNGRTPNEPPAKKSPKAITRDSLVSLLPVPTLMLPSTSDIIAVRADFEAKRREEHHTYLNELENVGRTILSKYAPRRIYTDDSDLALCAIHSGWVSWHGVKEAKRQGRDLRVDVRVMRVATLGAAGQWSGREVGKIVEVQSYGKAGKGSAAERERKEEVVTRFIGGLGERCWSAKGKRGLAELGDESVSVDVPSNPSNDGRALMSAAWGTGHDGAAIEVLSAGFVERAASRKVPGLGRRNRAQRMMEYAERRMAILGQSPQQHHPLLKTITNGNINPRIVSSLTAKPWNFTTTAIAGRKRRRGYGCANPPHPPINARLPNATLLEAINELDELEREKGGRGAKRRRTGSLSEVVRLPGKTQEEWREEALMNLKTIVFATNTVPPPVSAEDSYPTSPTSPAGLNPITAGLLTAGGPSRKDSTTGEAVRVGYKYDRAVLKQMLFPSDPLPPTSNSLKTSPAVDKEKAQLSHFLGTLPRRQVILETATKERYLLAPKRADGSSDIAVSDSRKVLWAYDISLILEQEVIVEDVKDDPSGNVLAASTTSPDEGPALSAAVEIPQLVEPIQDLPLATGEEKKDDSQVSIEEREEGELESTDQAEQLPQISEPPQSAKDQDGDVEMDDGDKEPGELNEEEERGKILEKQPEAPQPPVVLSPSPTPVTSPPILKLDTINLAPSRAVSRVNSKLNSPVNPHSSAAPSAVGLDIAMDIAEEEVEDESFVTLIRGEDEEGNEQSVHYLVQMLQRHVTEPMLRFEEEGIYVKEASFVGPTVPPSPSTSVAGEADMEKMDVVGQGPGGQPTEWRMQVVSWKWAGQAWADY